jgi:uncharacterized membrane protein YqaE (UPF0057 family)
MVLGAVFFPPIGVVLEFIHGSSWCDWSTVEW